MIMMIGHQLKNNVSYAFLGRVVFGKFARMSHMTNLVAFSTADRKLPLSRQPRPALNYCLIELLAGQSLLQLFRN